MDFQRYPLATVSSWLVAYPRTGEIVDGEQVFDPLPGGVTGDLQKSLADIPAFTLADLKQGLQLVQIEFGPSPTHPKDARYYATRLINRSDQMVRCRVFGAYRLVKGKFVLSTVTRTPFTAAQFCEWYGVDNSRWLMSGEVACDPSNYGGDGNSYWVYCFELESGVMFHTGAKIESRGDTVSTIFRKLFRSRS